MKHFRITLILLVACAAVVGYIFFYERGKPREEAAAARFDANKVVRMELRSKPSAKPVVMERINGQWRIASQANARADQARVGGLVDRIAWLETVGEVGVTKDLNKYGLVENAASITLILQGGKKVVLRLGSKTPDTQAAYAIFEGQPKVFLVHAGLLDEARRQPSVFRDISMVSLDRDDVYRITITRGPESITLQKSKNEWRLTQPIRAHANEEKLDMVLTNAVNLRTIEFVEEDPRDLAKYGLSQPRLVVDLYAKGQRKPVSLYFGRELEFGNVYAKTSAEKVVFVASKMAFDSVNRPLSDLRSKKLFVLETDKAERVALTSGNKTVEFSKKAGDAGRWEITAPARMAADAGEIGDLLFYLSRLEAGSFVEQPGPLSAYGLDRPSSEAAVWVKGRAKPLRLSLGTRADGSIYAASNSEPGVAKVDDYAVERIAPDAGSYREKTVLRFNRHQVRRLSISRAGQRVSVEWKRGGWQMTEPARGLADAGTVDSTIFTLQDLTADKLVADHPQNLAEYGLDKPRIEVEIGFSGSRKPMTLLVGKEGPGGQVYLMRKPGTTVFAKEKWVLDYLDKDESAFRR